MSTATVEKMDFPLFRQRFLGRIHVGPLYPAPSQADNSCLLSQPGTCEQPAQVHRPNLGRLDIRSLQRDDGPPSETQQRRQKYQFFDKHCSEVSPGLFLAGDTVARNRELLQENGVTHVLNCVGFVCKEYFRDQLSYRTYFLQDTPAEDILCVLYDAFDFIERAMKDGGKVLVHCSQGVSRSATIVIAYLMWKTGGTYEQVFDQVKQIRGVANPNIGFTCQLLQWQKRRKSPAAKSRMYRIAPHCQHSPTLLVPKMITPPKKYETHTWRQLDPRFAFIIQTPQQLYVWSGSHCTTAMTNAAQHHAALLQRYEGPQAEIITCKQGHEPAALNTLLDPPPLDADAERRNARRASITGDLYGTLSTAGSVVPKEDSNMETCDSMRVDSPKIRAGSMTQGSGMQISSQSSCAGSQSLSLGQDAEGDLPSPALPPDAPQPFSAPQVQMSPVPPVSIPSAPSARMSISSRLSVSSVGLLLSTRQSGSNTYSALPTPSALIQNITLTTPTAWPVQEQEEYSSDYDMYQDALRSQQLKSNASVIANGNASSGNALGGGDLGLNHPLNASVDVQAATASQRSEWTREQRVSVTGAERLAQFPARIPQLALGELGLIGELAPGYPGGPSSEGDDDSLLDSYGRNLISAKAFGSALVRPESPGAAEGRSRKYRRGLTGELSTVGDVETSKMGVRDISGLGGPDILHTKYFPSLHQSMDDEDMPGM